MQFLMSLFVGLLLGVIVSAESLLEGRVRLDSGAPVADAQVRLFDMTDLRQGAVARAQTDGTGYFALSLAALRGSALPEDFALGPNYPNPFNPSTIIPYQLAASSQVRLEVFNLLGQRIATLVDGERPAGFHTATWTATDGAGRAVGAGVYIYRMTVGMESQTGRMVLLDGQAGVSAGGAASVMPGAAGGGSDGESAYGLIVSGSGLVPYVDSSFRVEGGMAPVELVVSSGSPSAGKVMDDDCALCDLFAVFNDQQEEEADETEEGEAETDSTSSEGGPDLIVQSPSVSAAVLTPGEAFTLNATVHNQGDEQAAATMLHYYRSNNATITASDTEVGTDAIGTLDASATSEASIALTAPTGISPEVGIYYGACVASVSGESNTDNNCSTAVRITVSGQETTEEAEEETPVEEEDDALSSPPPTWVFVGDVPAADQAELREEMEAVRAFFAEQYGVEATGFTVVVGTDFETFDLALQDLTGFKFYHGATGAPTAGGFVTSSTKGSAVVALVYGEHPTDSHFSSVKHSVVHEYFHVLQGQLVSGFAQLQDGEIAWGSDRGPYWLVEGLASYADYVYTLSRSDRSPFLGGRYTPYIDLKEEDLDPDIDVLRSRDLGKMVEHSSFHSSFNPSYSYALSFVASIFLSEQVEEDSYVDYWKLLHDRPAEEAFEEAFGISVEVFYEAFYEWLPSQLSSLPDYVQKRIQIRWPGMKADELVWLDIFLEDWRIPSSSYIVSRDNPLFADIEIVYELGLARTVHLSRLSCWVIFLEEDQDKMHLLGWYKDGVLTDQPEEATPVELTSSSPLEWVLPAHPATLPRLKSALLSGKRYRTLPPLAK